ncbi:MAG: SAM-dependent methyltransferase [Candidatus Micrarchaeota archaeon]
MKFMSRKEDTEYLYDEQWVYARKGDDLFKLAVFDKHLYKLRMMNGAPVLEIDGLRMQLVKNFKTPLDYSKEVAGILEVTKEDVVLDTCMGLGYTAIACSKAKEITTCEINDAVYTLASWSPFSTGLFSKNIKIIRGDIAEEIKKFDSESFSVIIHDPPRFSLAQFLYSTPFYEELKRVAKPDARLFHYVGSLGKSKGRNIAQEVQRRLEKVGFRDINYKEKYQGLFFRK